MASAIREDIEMAESMRGNAANTESLKYCAKYHQVIPTRAKNVSTNKKSAMNRGEAIRNVAIALGIDFRDVEKGVNLIQSKMSADETMARLETLTRRFKSQSRKSYDPPYARVIVKKRR